MEAPALHLLRRTEARTAILAGLLVPYVVLSWAVVVREKPA